MSELQLLRNFLDRKGDISTEKKESLYLVASGQIENPPIEIEVGGEKQRFSGRDARVFAFGMLAGLKASKDYFAAEVNIKDEQM